MDSVPIVVDEINRLFGGFFADSAGAVVIGVDGYNGVVLGNGDEGVFAVVGAGERAVECHETTPL